MVRRKTHDEFVAEVKALVGDEYAVLSKYEGALRKVVLNHKSCRSSFEMNPNSFLMGSRCPECQKHYKQKTHSEFSREFEKFSEGEYELLGKYEKCYKKIEIRHNLCGEKFHMRPNSFLTGQRCPKCAKETGRLQLAGLNATRRKSQDVFTQELLLARRGEFVLLGQYEGTSIEHTFKHTYCGGTFRALPSRILTGSKCSVCQENISKGEFKIREWLEKKGIRYDAQYNVKYSESKRALRLDFYVQGVAIEFDGEYHYVAKSHAGGEEGLRAQQRRDAIKTQYCADNGIPLIRIPYWDFDNIDAILTKKLLPLLKVDASSTQKQAS
ncbi:hypothetical protein [Lysinibacillus xylanilyticus]|uniref:hypothetical protein n=1 Tax=Lysinibacillus xylanilyticus TaxID=582475 RepID=UPI003D005B6F